MQTAPSVDFPVGRFFFSAWIGFALSALSIAGFLWAVIWGHVTLETSLAFFLLWIALAYFTYWKYRPGQAKCWLSWDGDEWRVHSLQVLVSESSLGAAPSNNSEIQGAFSMQVHMDMQQCLFLSLVNLQGDRHWFWVLQKSFPDRWHGFRCAVYSPYKSSIFQGEKF